MRVLLISGRQGAGKTTLANLVAKHFFEARNFRIEKFNFADCIYEIHDFALNRLAEYGIKREGLKKDGYLLQLLGTQWGRQTIGEDVWVRALKGKIERNYKAFQTDLFIIADARFENEFDAFPDALRVRLNAAESVRKERCSMWRETTNHASETSLDAYTQAGKFDYTFNSDKMSAESIALMIIDKIEKGGWKSRRKIDKRI